MSRWYDLVEGPFERSSRERGQTLLHVKPGEYVLEIGFGTGQSLVAFARAVGSTGTVCGIDLSEGMCRVAQARLQKAHLAARVALTCGDAAQLPYAARSFDAVFLSFTLELFDTPDILPVLRECARVLRDGGHLGVVALAWREKATPMSRLYAWAHRRFPRLVDCRPIPVRQVVAEAGFQVEAVVARSIWGLPVDVVMVRKGA
jgi:ubiquinone/menaquinone biosynthesis C-methylase UbiE